MNELRIFKEMQFYSYTYLSLYLLSTSPFFQGLEKMGNKTPSSTEFTVKVHKQFPGQRGDHMRTQTTA